MTYKCCREHYFSNVFVVLVSCRNIIFGVWIVRVVVCVVGVVVWLVVADVGEIIIFEIHVLRDKGYQKIMCCSRSVFEL